MTKSTAIQPSKKRNAITRFILPGLGWLVIGIIVYSIAAFFYNYAAEVAEPIERSLSAQGAIKKCSTGDGGHGPDNTEPWYYAYFQVPAGKTEAIEIAKKAARAGGYNIKQATLEKRGHVSVADMYINDWYYDSKKSEFVDLESGDIEVSITVNAEGSDGDCNGNKLIISESQSVIGVRVSLPVYKSNY